MYSASRAAPILSDREVEVARHLIEGRSNRDIAALLNISARTVQSHVANAMEKTDARSRTHLAVWVLRAGLVPLDATRTQCPFCAL